MNHFKYQYLEIKCWFNNQLIPQQQTFTTQFNGQGFTIDKDNPAHWITFTIFESKIRAFYKQVHDNNRIIYYQQDCPKQETINLTFTYLDIVEKINGKWKYRNK
jgi:hypothetical protein